MRITFVHSYYEYENLNIEYLSSTLKEEGHKVSLALTPKLFGMKLIKRTPYSKNIFNGIRKQLIEKVITSKPDLIAFSVHAQTYSWALETAKAIKSRLNIPIVFGGAHITLLPEIVIKNACVDILCLGEGEKAMVDLANSIKEGRPTNYQIPNLWFKKDGQIIKNEMRPLMENLDLLPFPDKELFYAQQSFVKKQYLTMTGRGCPFSCSYCINSALKKEYGEKNRYVRRKSISNILSELAWAKKKFKTKNIKFYDPNFIPLDTDWLEQFLFRYKKEIGLPFQCMSRSDLITDKIIKLLKETGCFLVVMGIESVSEDTRNKILKRPMSNKQIESACKTCVKYKLNFGVTHIFNLPYETEKEQTKALEFYNKIRPNYIAGFSLAYYPKLEIIKDALKAGAIDKETVAKINSGIFIKSPISGKGSVFKSEKDYYSFIFLFDILPLMPKPIMKVLIKKRKLLLPLMTPLFYYLFPICRMIRYMKIMRKQNEHIAAIKNLICRLLKRRYI